MALANKGTLSSTLRAASSGCAVLMIARNCLQSLALSNTLAALTRRRWREQSATRHAPAYPSKPFLHAPQAPATRSEAQLRSTPKVGSFNRAIHVPQQAAPGLMHTI
eukprot:1161698-Pelagomonas_calceolata.AAC.15